MQIDYTDPFAAQQAQAQASLQAAQQAKQYRTPQGPGMVGRVYVGAHPLQGLAELLRTRQAANQEEEAMQQLQGIGAQRQEAQNRDMSAFVQALRGTPAQPAFEAAGPAPQGAPQEGGYTVPAQAAKAGDPYAAYSQAMTSQSPMVRQMGMQGMAQLPQLEAAKAEKEAYRAWQENQKELDRKAREDQIRLTAQLTAANRPERQAQIIQTEQGPMQLVNGQAVPIMGVGGVPVKGGSANKTLTSGEVDKITGLDESLGTQQRLAQTFKPEYANYGSNLLGSAANMIGSRFSDKLQPQAEWWAAQEANDNVMRNKLFGASLTKGEQEAWDRTSIKPGMSDKMITERMAERAALIEAQRNTRLENLGRAGYNVSNFGAPPQAFKPQQSSALPSADAIAAELARRGGK